MWFKLLDCSFRPRAHFSSGGVVVLLSQTEAELWKILLHYAVKKKSPFQNKPAATSSFLALVTREWRSKELLFYGTV